MDIATIAGLVGAFALIVIAMVLGGSPLAFVDIPSVLIVLGGTFAVTMSCFSLPEMFGAGKIVAKAMFKHGQSPVDAANRILELADMARKQGLLNIQSMIEEHLSGKVDHNFRLWILLNLELWYRMYFEELSISDMQEFTAEMMQA